jgi:hypothetical protein
MRAAGGGRGRRARAAAEQTNGRGPEQQRILAAAGRSGQGSSRQGKKKHRPDREHNSTATKKTINQKGCKLPVIVGGQIEHRVAMCQREANVQL